MFKSARNNVSERMYMLEDIKVVECATFLRTEFVCSHATVVMDVPEIIGLYNVKSILTDNSI